MAAGVVEIEVKASGSSYSQAIDQMGKKLDTLAGKATGVGHATVSGTQAASGALRLLEGNVQNNIRAVERFLTTIPGVGQALQKAFPLVGIAAFAGILAETGQKLYAFVEDVRAMPAALQKGFGDLNRSAEASGAALDVTNDRLQIQIDKLERKPSNLLKLALDEDREAAYAFASALESATGKVDALLKKSHVGVGTQLGQLASGILSGLPVIDLQARTGHAEANIRATFASLDKVADEGIRKLEKARPDQAETIKAANREAERNALLDARNTNRTQLAQARQADKKDPLAGHGDEITMYEGTDRQLTARLHDFDATNQRDDGQIRLARDQANSEAQTRAGEARRKAAEARMKGFESQLAQMKETQDVTVNDEFDFWQKMLQPAAAYPDNLLKVQERVGQARQAIGRELDEMLRKLDESNARTLAKRTENEREITRQADEQDRQRAEQQARLAQFTANLADVQREDATSLIALVAAHDASTGAITKHQLAMIEAQLHAANYRSELEKLADEQKKDAALLKGGQLTQDAYDANQKGRDVRKEQLDGRQQQQGMIDQWNVEQTTARGQFIEMLQQISAAGHDTATQMRELAASMVSETNRTLLDLITEKHTRGEHPWKQLAHSGLKQVANVGLQKSEGYAADALEKMMPGTKGLLEKLGLGPKTKAPTGAASDPLHVIMQNPPQPGAPPVPGAPAPAGGNSGTASLIAQVLPFIPGFADGTDYAPGGLAWVGEQGPELMHLPRGASITPNEKSMAMVGGSSHTHNWHIDARGSTDPAQVRAQVQAGIAQAMPHIHQSTHAYVADQKRRSTQPTR